MDACPPLEDIAAFLDGTLSPEERARITEHLARCESCYEIFAGAVHFQEDEEEEAPSAGDIDGGDVIQFPLAQGTVQENQVRVEPARPPRRASWWLSLAASFVLVAGLGFMIWQYFRALPEISIAGLVEPLQHRPHLVERRYQPKDVERGAGEEAEALFSQAPPFFVGVYLVDLRLSTMAGEVEDTQKILDSLYVELDQIPFGHPEAVDLKKKADGLTDSAALQRFTSSLPQRESDLQSWLAEYPFFRFGLWTEAGRLSAVTRSPKFFEQRMNRRFLSAIPREIASESDDRYGPILDDLQKIAPLWDRDKRSKEDYNALAALFESILDRMVRIQKEDQEDLGLSADP